MAAFSAAGCREERLRHMCLQIDVEEGRGLKAVGSAACPGSPRTGPAEMLGSGPQL